MLNFVSKEEVVVSYLHDAFCTVTIKKVTNDNHIFT